MNNIAQVATANAAPIGFGPAAQVQPAAGAVNIKDAEPIAADVFIPISGIHIKKYYEDFIPEEQCAVFEVMGIKFVCVKGDGKRYYIPRQFLTEVVDYLKLAY